MRFASLLIILAALAAAGTAPARAQRAGDTTSVDCPAPGIANRCVEFDARRSVDSLAGPQTYLWDMGDGTVLSGFRISHCYADFRAYTVRLDVQMEATGELRYGERTFTVPLQGQELLDFTTSATQVRVGEAVVFEAPETILPDCQNLLLTWDFRDGFLGRGRQVSHRFRKVGTFQVRLSVRAFGRAPCTDSHCVSRPVVVVE